MRQQAVKTVPDAISDRCNHCLFVDLMCHVKSYAVESADYVDGSWIH